jgi:hypothetical protein
VTHLGVAGTLTLECQTNNLSGQMGFASSRQVTALMVGSVTVAEM